MLIKTIGKNQWSEMTSVGNVEYNGEHIIARPHEKHRSEAKIQQFELRDEIEYRYSFRLTGQFQDTPCILLQFHDWWGEREKKTYAATSPPISFWTNGSRLFLSVNEILEPPVWNESKGHFVVGKSRKTDIDLQPIFINEWNELCIRVKWSQLSDGFVLCNGRGLTGFCTMFNDNPCDIQFGLYGKSQFTSNEIREISC